MLTLSAFKIIQTKLGAYRPEADVARQRTLVDKTSYCQRQSLWLRLAHYFAILSAGLVPVTTSSAKAQYFFAAFSFVAGFSEGLPKAMGSEPSQLLLNATSSTRNATTATTSFTAGLSRGERRNQAPYTDNKRRLFFPPSLRILLLTNLHQCNLIKRKNFGIKN